MIFVKCIC